MPNTPLPSNAPTTPDTKSTIYVVAALYHFATLDNHEDLREPLLETMAQHHICGTLLLAEEGINGTVAGSRAGIDALLASIRSDPRLADLSHKESHTNDPPFRRAKVKLKREIVTLGVEPDMANPNKNVGIYVDPENWNDLISDPEVLLLDTRNDYEVGIGTFQDAIDPDIETFRDFPQYVQEHLDPKRHKKVAMFCTGGIRCEKSTAYLRSLGFESVYHLKGGILKYLEEVPKEASLWRGECYVFDERISVDHALQPGQYDQCYACGFPITDEAKQSEQYERGVSCPHCIDQYDEPKRASFRQRQKQIDLAKQRGESHLKRDASLSN